jgi:hypothetical protein
MAKNLITPASVLNIFATTFLLCALSSSPASALDAGLSGEFSGSIPAVGCDNSNLVIRDSSWNPAGSAYTGGQGYFIIGIGNGPDGSFTGYHVGEFFVENISDVDGGEVVWRAETPQTPTASNFDNIYCNNISDVVEISSQRPNNYAEYISAAFWGTVFEANTYEDDAIRRYRYTVGIEGVVDSKLVWRRVLVSEEFFPVADAGPDQTVTSGAVVLLDGTQSTDPDLGQPLTYDWWNVPDGITLSDATDARPTFTAPTLAVGDADVTFVFHLSVTNSQGVTSDDEVAITVTAPSDAVVPDAPTLVVNGNPDGTVTASGTAEPSSVVTITFPDGSTVTTTAAEDGSYTVTSAAAQPSGDVTATATDAAGNVSPEASKPYVAANTVSKTQEQIAGFMLGRANNLASNQPGLARFLMGEGCGTFNASATEGSGSVSGCATRGNTWAEINGSWSGDGSYTLGTIGAHASPNPNLLVGGMVQFDYTDDPANNASGKGWMFGPYFVAKTPNQPLYFEGRLLYGQTDNEITPLGTYTDSFETERLLAQLRASGQYEFKNTTLMPLLDFTYTEDRQKAYTDSLGNTIPDQTVDLMQVSAGLDFSTPLSVQMGSLELTGGIKGIYSSSNGATAAPEFENWRGRTHIGLNYDSGRGTTVRFGSFYDGLGTNYESYGANLNFDMRF